MKRSVLGLIFLTAAGAVLADEAGDCKQAAGVYRTGVVKSAPKFVHGQFRKGVELSHTHLTLLADQDGKSYDVAIDNVFAAGYDARKGGVPAPLNGIKVSDRLAMCGELYTKGVGIHWVHTNCGITPSPAKPDGWLKKLTGNGAESDNFEGSREYCKLF